MAAKDALDSPHREGAHIAESLPGARHFQYTVTSFIRRSKFEFASGTGECRR